MHAYRRPTIATAVWRRALQQPEPRRRVFAPFHRVYKPLVVILPFAGATAYLAYRATHKEPSAKLLLHSQSIIPPNAKVYAPLNLSPVEPRFSPFSRFLDFIRFRILEPLFTSGRFVHLCILFLPVIFSAPLLLLGPVDARSGERWGAVWWYGFLVKQMERAGPTFIKVCLNLCEYKYIIVLTLPHSSRNGQARVPTSSRQSCVSASAHCTQAARSTA